MQQLALNHGAAKIILEILALLLFCCMPFMQINHTVIYVLIECIGVYGLYYAYCHPQLIISDPLIRYYLYFLAWCVVVTLLSVNIGTSFKGLTVLLLIPPMCAALYNGWILKYIHHYIAILSIVIFITNLASLFYLHFHIVYPILAWCARTTGGKVDSSSLAAYLIVYTLFFNANLRWRLMIIMLNLASGIMLGDANFIITLSVIMLLYYSIIMRGIHWYKIVLTLIVLLVLLKYLLINVLHLNLHIYERTLIYSYWLPKVFYSPVHGIGLSLKLESQFIPRQFPIAPYIMAIDSHIKLHAHNYFIDLVMQTGFVGLILMLMFYYKMCRYTYRLANLAQTSHVRRTSLAVSFMLLAVLLSNMVNDTLEGARYLIPWFFIILTYITIVNLDKTYAPVSNN